MIDDNDNLCVCVIYFKLHVLVTNVDHFHNKSRLLRFLTTLLWALGVGVVLIKLRNVKLFNYLAHNYNSHLDSCVGFTL